MIEPTNNPEQPKKPEKSNFLSRFLVANAFSAIGTKLMFLGTVADLNNLVGKELTLGEKFKGVFSKDILQKMRDRAHYLEDHEDMHWLKAWGKTFKWTVVVGTIATSATFAIGWVRGGLIDDWKDIGNHPWRSLKIVLGFEAPPASKVEPAQPMPSTLVSEEPKAATPKWSDKITTAASHADAVTQQKASETAAFVG